MRPLGFNEKVHQIVQVKDLIKGDTMRIEGEAKTDDLFRLLPCI